MITEEETQAARRSQHKTMLALTVRAVNGEDHPSGVAAGAMTFAVAFAQSQDMTREEFLFLAGDAWDRCPSDA